MYKFRVSCMILSVDQLLCCYIMGGGNLMKTCTICLKTMRGDNLTRHIKQHEKKPLSIDEAESHMSGEMKNVDEAENGTSSVKCTNIDLKKLERNVKCEVMSSTEKLNLEEI